MSVLAQVLPQILPDLKDNVFDYSSIADFKKLWKFEGLPEKRIVIAWTLTAPDPGLAPINAADCLSPLDWAAAYVKHLPPSPENWPQILVIDASSQSHLCVPTLAHFYTLRPEQLPWLTVLNRPSLADLLNWLGTQNQTGNIPALDRFLREIRLNLTDVRSIGDYDRHSISNIVAPMVLLGDAVQKTPHSDALLKLLQACELCGPSETPDDKRSTDEGVGHGHDLHILLVDDQAEHGWKEWLEKSLKPVWFEHRTDPNDLLDALEKQFAAADAEAMTTRQGTKAKDLRFRFQLPGIEDATNPVLFLDLRLFSGKPHAERAFFQRLLKLIETRFLGSVLAWPGFNPDDDAFKMARAALESVQEDRSGNQNIAFAEESTERHEALTWLPQVLALADMSLPIILFSSTGRRDLVEPFKPYGNIITSFEKPRLGGHAAIGSAGPGIPSSTQRCLRDAVNNARKWLRARAVCMRVLDTKLEALGQARRQFADTKAIELFHDESGEVEKAYFRVSTLLVGFASDNLAKEINEKFPVRFYGHGCLDKRAAGQPSSPEDYLTAEKERWRDEIWGPFANEAPPVLLSVAARDRETSNIGNPMSIFDPVGLDNINWDLLSLQWECLLVDVLPALLQERVADDDLRIRLYGATRYRPVPLNATSTQSALTEANHLVSDLRQHWGLNLLGDYQACFVTDERRQFVSFIDRRTNALVKTANYPGNGTKFTFFWRTLKEDSFWKLVADILFARRESAHYTTISKAIESASGVSLAYGEGKQPDPRCRHLHYLADVAGGLVDTDIRSERVCLTSEPFNDCSHRATVGFRHRLLSLLNANRLLDVGECDCEALAVFEQIDHEHAQDLAYLALAERLQQRLTKLRGIDLLRLVVFLAHQPSWIGKNRIQTPERIARANRQRLPTARSQPMHASSRSPKNARNQAKQEFLDDTIFIRGIPPGCHKIELSRELESMGIRGKITAYWPMGSTKCATVQVGQADLRRILSDFRTGIELFNVKCSVRQSFK
ncbi:MAG TPA: hypothetical protein PLU30_00305 [Verrucomicrobiae bacterium]|nr:hypothetical protein [Verrucomicrobiae bacterium]